MTGINKFVPAQLKSSLYGLTGSGSIPIPIPFNYFLKYVLFV